MKTGIIIAGVTVLLAGIGVRAADDRGKSPTLSIAQNSGGLFREDETTLDLFGGLTLNENTINNISGARVRDDGRLGAGAGLNYFFTRHVGVGAEGYSENTAHSLVDHASGNLFVRVPLGESGIAPYIFGGGGHIFDPLPATSAHGGGGIEFRFTSYFGIFADARYVFTDTLGNYGLGRAGLRLSF